MRYGLDIAKLADDDGLGTFVRELLAALTALGTPHDFYLYDLLGSLPPEKWPAETQRLIPRPGRNPEGDRLDAFLATTFSAPSLGRTPLLFAIYDLTFLTLPECHTPSNRLHCFEGTLRALVGGALFAAISQATAQDLVRELAVPPDRIHRISLAAHHDFRPMAANAVDRALEAWKLEPGFVLSVGSLEPRKNLERLLGAHEALPAKLRAEHPLVIAGGCGWRNEALLGRLEAAAERGGVHLLGHVDRAQLVALYNGAALFAYPSLAEGFGLPVIEAMACGAPVLTSDLSALPETAGGAARLVDPSDQAALDAALRDLLADAVQRAGLRERGFARAAELSWTATAGKVLGLLELAASSLR